MVWQGGGGGGGGGGARLRSARVFRNSVNYILRLQFFAAAPTPKQVHRYLEWRSCPITRSYLERGMSFHLLVDLRSAQVYCVAIFLVSQEVSLNFHRCCGKKLWVGWVGRGYTEISRYFPAAWINWVTLVTKIKLCIHWDFRSPLNHQKCLYGMIFLRLRALFCV